MSPSSKQYSESESPTDGDETGTSEQQTVSNEEVGPEAQVQAVQAVQIEPISTPPASANRGNFTFPNVTLAEEPPASGSEITPPNSPKRQEKGPVPSILPKAAYKQKVIIIFFKGKGLLELGQVARTRFPDHTFEELSLDSLGLPFDPTKPGSSRSKIEEYFSDAALGHLRERLDIQNHIVFVPEVTTAAINGVLFILTAAGLLHYAVVPTGQDLTNNDVPVESINNVVAGRSRTATPTAQVPSQEGPTCEVLGDGETILDLVANLIERNTSTEGVDQPITVPMAAAAPPPPDPSPGSNQETEGDVRGRPPGNPGTLRLNGQNDRDRPNQEERNRSRRRRGDRDPLVLRVDSEDVVFDNDTDPCEGLLARYRVAHPHGHPCRPKGQGCGTYTPNQPTYWSYFWFYLMISLFFISIMITLIIAYWLYKEKAVWLKANNLTRKRVLAHSQRTPESFIEVVEDWIAQERLLKY